MAASEQSSSLNLFWLTGCYVESCMAGLGRKYPVASGRFQESGFDWPLSGYEFEVGTVTSRPKAVVGNFKVPKSGFCLLSPFNRIFVGHL